MDTIPMQSKSFSFWFVFTQTATSFKEKYYKLFVSPQFHSTVTTECGIVRCFIIQTLRFQLAFFVTLCRCGNQRSTPW